MFEDYRIIKSFRLERISNIIESNYLPHVANVPHEHIFKYLQRWQLNHFPWVVCSSAQ